MTTITTTETGASGRYINLGSPASQDDLTAQTIIVYCKPASAAPAVTGYLWSKCDSGGIGRRLSISLADGTIAFAANSTGTAGGPVKLTSSSVTAATWQHIQATWDGTLNVSGINIYKDASASLATTQADSGTGAISSDASLDQWLMNRQGLGREFVGDLAYVARWNRVLSDAERTTVRADGPRAVPSGLVLCWANDRDYSDNAVTAAARSTLVAGSAPTNTALGGTDPSDLSGSATLDGISVEGVLSAVLPDSSLSGTVALDEIAVAGSMGMAMGAGVTAILTNNNATVLASVTGVVINFYHPNTGALVLRKTGLASDSAGIVSFSDAALVPGTSYAYEVDLSAAGLGRRLPIVVVT